MVRRHDGNMSKEQQYCADTEKKVVHDLDNERVTCGIDEFIEAGKDKAFKTLAEAHEAGYENCRDCLGAARSQWR